MASAPKCKVCGAAHWSSQPHAFADKPRGQPTLVDVVKAKPELLRQEPSTVRAPPVIAADVAAYIAAEKAKRAAYMRDYRARKKAP